MIYGFIGFVVVLAWHIISEMLWRKERSQLIDRLMAKTYQEFKYYDSQYKEDLDTIKKVRKTELKKMEDMNANKIDEEAERYLSQLEEDWRPETLDEKLLKSRGIDNEYEDNRENNS